MLAALYTKLDAPLIRTDLETAEMVKYVDNSWHALKIGFANEIGNLCKSFGVDAHEVMKIFCQDQKLNISPAYLLPVLPSAARACPRTCGRWPIRPKCTICELPILTSILPSNEMQVARGLQLIMEKGPQARRHSGLQLQGRNRRSAGEPGDRSHRASHRQRLRPAHL